METKPGDKVEIKTKEKTYVGTLMPQDKEIVVVKLNSGYNVGIDKSKIESINLIEKHITKTQNQLNKKEEMHNNSLPKISILHTGGTIASKVDYETGGVIARFSPEELIGMFPEIAKIAKISSRLIRNMWSEDMRFAHYNIMAKEVEKEIKSGAKGVIITHGTDTMHYSGAALSFALENLSVPVILVGAQRSSDRPSSDAAYNAISAAYFIVEKNYPGVYICMHEGESDEICTVLFGLKARKMHSSRRDAFKPINKGVVAKINFKHKKIEMLEQNKKAEGSLSLKLFDENLKIALIKSHPQMFPEEILNCKNFDGMILEGTGLGHFPVSEIDELTKVSTQVLSAIKEVAKKIPVAMTSQTIYGRINMNVYSAGRNIVDAGVLGNMCDMHPETAYIKLAWLLSNHKAKVKDLYDKNLRGEITERTENEFDLF